MKAKKWLTIITGSVSLISLIIAICIGNGSSSIFYDFSMAVFGSALLGAIMSLTEYYVERRKAMEQFWSEARTVLNELRKIRYINVDAPHDLIHACFYEADTNELQAAFSGAKSEEAKNNLLSWFEENIVMSFNENDDVDAILNWFYEDKIEYFRREYQRAIDSYATASKIDIGPLSNAYGGLDFFRNSTIRNNAYCDIYQKIREVVNLLIKETYHFDLLAQKHGRFSVCADKAYQICQHVFREENKTVGGFAEKVVYQGLFDEIADSLEKFRCEIYRNEKYTPVEKTPVLGSVQTISFEWKKTKV